MILLQQLLIVLMVPVKDSVIVAPTVEDILSRLLVFAKVNPQLPHMPLTFQYFHVLLDRNSLILVQLILQMGHAVVQLLAFLSNHQKVTFELLLLLLNAGTLLLLTTITIREYLLVLMELKKGPVLVILNLLCLSSLLVFAKVKPLFLGVQLAAH
jgi:hypothetical protein